MHRVIIFTFWHLCTTSFCPSHIHILAHGNYYYYYCFIFIDFIFDWLIDWLMISLTYLWTMQLSPCLIHEDAIYIYLYIYINIPGEDNEVMKLRCLSLREWGRGMHASDWNLPIKSKIFGMIFRHLQ